MDIPLGSASAQEMITSGFYADKTAFVAKLFEKNKQIFFLNRPRRFGKSLFIDTINEVSNGIKDLFINCKIYKEEKHQWLKYPVIRLSFTNYSSNNIKNFSQDFNTSLFLIAKKYNIHNQLVSKIEGSSNSFLLEIIEKSKNIEGYQPSPIILIDEYDKTLLSCEQKNYKEFLNIITTIFDVLKNSASEFKFMFVTGVTRIHLSSIMSGANSMIDVSLYESYSDVLGFTESDIENLFFSKKILIDLTLEKQNKIKKEKWTVLDLKKNLKMFYNGYNFSPYIESKVYNPHSILNFFSSKNFDKFWCNTCCPSILIKKMEQSIETFNIDWNKDNFLISKDEFNVKEEDYEEYCLLSLMSQTGYLTFDLISDEDFYYLKFPNMEVKLHLKFLVNKILTQKQKDFGVQSRLNILSFLRNQKWAQFFNEISSSCLAKAGYRFLDKTEKSFQSVLSSFLAGAFNTNFRTQVSTERDSAKERIDILIEDCFNGKKTVFIFELKVDKTSSQALNQIKDKDYSIQFHHVEKKVLIGLNYCSKKLNINEALVEVYELSEESYFEKISLSFFKTNDNGFFKQETI